MSRGARCRRLEDEFYRIMTLISNRNWREFARLGLNLAAYQIDDIEADHARDVKEQKYQMLSLWQRKNGRRATIEELEKIVHDYNNPPPRPPANQNTRPMQQATSDVGDRAPEGDASSLISQPSSIEIRPAQENQSRNGSHHRTSDTEGNHESLVHSDQSLAQRCHQGHPTGNSSNNHSTRPKLPSSDVSETVRGVQRLNVTPPHNMIPNQFMEMMGASSININVTGQHAIGVQNNVIMGNPRRVTPSRPRQASTDMAKYCDKVGTIVVHDADPDSYENHFLDDGIYRIVSKPKGLALIINNSFVGQNDERKGSDEDVKHLEILLRKLGFEVFLKTEHKAAEIKETLSKFAVSKKAAAANVIAVFIMSHGSREKGHDVFYGVDRDPVRISEMLEFFNNKRARSLKGIPKLFFIQSCRGDGVDMGVEAENVEESLQSLRTTVEQCNPTRLDVSDTGPITSKTLPTVSDMMVSYATQRGQRAFRNNENGSWYINAIVNIFMEYACKEHVVDLMTKVNRAVAAKSVYNPDDHTIHGAKAMSDINSSLMKKLFLFPGFPVETAEDDF